MKIPIKLLNSNAKVPVYSKEDDAAMDLYASEDAIIECLMISPVSKYFGESPTNSYRLDINNRKLVSTGIALAIPPGYYGRVAPRSGLSCKGVDVGAGVVDAGYRGEVKILLINNGNLPFKINKHDRIAQLIVTKIAESPELEVVTDLPSSDRGAGGFGSTGTN